MKLIIQIQPFAAKQSIDIYNALNERVGAMVTTISNLVSDTFALVDSYSQNKVNQISIIGPRKYCNDLCLKMKEKELAKYGNNNIKIEVL